MITYSDGFFTIVPLIEIFIGTSEEDAMNHFKRWFPERIIVGCHKCEEHFFSLNGRYSRYFTNKK